MLLAVLQSISGVGINRDIIYWHRQITDKWHQYVSLLNVYNKTCCTTDTLSEVNKPCNNNSSLSFQRKQHLLTVSRNIAVYRYRGFFGILSFSIQHISGRYAEMGRRKEEWREDRQTRQTTINFPAAAKAAAAAVKILEAERNSVITSHPGTPNISETE